MKLNKNEEIILENLRKRGLGKNNVPVLSFSFLDWINSYDWSDYSYLELGSGNSTNYMANIFKNVCSLEHDINYYNKLLENKKDNVDCVLLSIDDIDFGNYDLNFDNKILVMIDHNGNKFYAVKSLLMKCTPNIILIDNSEWNPMACKFVYDNGYSEIPIWGIRPEENFNKCTSIFIKNGYQLPEKKYNFTPEDGTSLSDIWNYEYNNV